MASLPPLTKQRVLEGTFRSIRQVLNSVLPFTFEASLCMHRWLRLRAWDFVAAFNGAQRSAGARCRADGQQECQGAASAEWCSISPTEATAHSGHEIASGPPPVARALELIKIDAAHEDRTSPDESERCPVQRARRLAAGTDTPLLTRQSSLCNTPGTDLVAVSEGTLGPMNSLHSMQVLFMPVPLS